MMRNLILLLVAVGLALPLSACGRKSTPLPPEGAFYPYKYPYTPFPKSQEEPAAQRRSAEGEEFAPPEPVPGKPFQLERPAGK